MALNNSVKTLLINTIVISLADTPMMNAMPPVWPLFKLCLRIENITGPTEMLSKSPRVIPLRSISSIKNAHRTFYRGTKLNDNEKYFITILIGRRTLVRLQVKAEVDHCSYKLIFVCFYPTLASFNPYRSSQFIRPVGKQQSG